MRKDSGFDLMTGTAGVRDTLLSDDLEIEGSQGDLGRVFTLFDKPPGTFWFDSHLVARTGPTKVHYDIDTAGGQSGAAAYVINDDSNRIAVAVHAYGGTTTNSGTRITAPVFENFKAWKA